MTKSKFAVLMLGRLPPPIGGVTISVENLFLALTSTKVEVGFLMSGLNRRYDIAHIHAYDAKKRFLLAVLAKIFAKRTVFTIHGMHFDDNDWFNRLTLRLVNGVVVLNDNIVSRSCKLNQLPLLKVSSMVLEGLKQPEETPQLLPSKKEKPRLLVYAQHGNTFEGEPIYGVPFILENLRRILESYSLVVVDLENAYPEFESFLTQDVTRFTSPVDFKQLLTEVDVYIRPTSKDGDSVAIREALMLKVPVVASDVVERAKGVIQYHYLDKDDFFEKIEYALHSDAANQSDSLSSVEQYLSFYDDILSR